MKIEDVAKQVGLSYRTVYRYLEESGKPLPPKIITPRQIDMGKVRQAHALYAEHGNKAKVARLMDMSDRQMGRYLKMVVDDEK